MLKPTISRQRLWQIRNRKAGKCVQCGKPSKGRKHCDVCAVKQTGVQKRHPLREEWAKVNWYWSDAVIAQHMGVTVPAVSYQRRKISGQPLTNSGEVSASPANSILAAATNDGQWLTLYKDGRLRLHARPISASPLAPWRVAEMKLRSKQDRAMARRVIHTLNLMAHEEVGLPVPARDSFHAYDF